MKVIILHAAPFCVTETSLELRCCSEINSNLLELESAAQRRPEENCQIRAKTFLLHLIAIPHSSLQHFQLKHTTVLNTTPSEFYFLATIHMRTS